MKRIIIGLIFVLLIVGGSFIVNNHHIKFNKSDNSQQSIMYSQNGITLSMPSDWISADSKSNKSILAIADPNSKDSYGFNNININIEKKSDVSSLESEFNSTYKNLTHNSDFNILFEGNVSFKGKSAIEIDYTCESNGEKKRHKAIWIQNDSDIYVILCSTPESKFEEESNTIDFIINSIKL